MNGTDSERPEDRPADPAGPPLAAAGGQRSPVEHHGLSSIVTACLAGALLGGVAGLVLAAIVGLPLAGAPPLLFASFAVIGICSGTAIAIATLRRSTSRAQAAAGVLDEWMAARALHRVQVPASAFYPAGVRSASSSTSVRAVGGRLWDGVDGVIEVVRTEQDGADGTMVRHTTIVRLPMSLGFSAFRLGRTAGGELGRRLTEPLTGHAIGPRHRALTASNEFNRRFDVRVDSPAEEQLALQLLTPDATTLLLYGSRTMPVIDADGSTVTMSFDGDLLTPHHNAGMKPLGDRLDGLAPLVVRLANHASRMERYRAG